MTLEIKETGISEQILREIFELKKYIGKVEIQMKEISDTVSEISTRTGSSSSRRISDASSLGNKSTWSKDFVSKTAFIKSQKAGITASDFPLEKRSGCSGTKITCKDIKIYTELNNIDTGEKRCEGVNAKGEVCGHSGNNQCGTSYYCHRHVNVGRELHKRRVADERRERMEDVLSGVEELEGGDLYNKDNPPEIYLGDGKLFDPSSVKEIEISDDEDPFVKKLPIKPIIKKNKKLKNKKIKEEIIEEEVESIVEEIDPDIKIDSDVEEEDPDIDKVESDVEEDPDIEEDYPSEEEEEESVDD